jgi:putative transposase
VPRRQRDQSAGIRHVTCRGNRRQALFRDLLDREWYLGLLETTCRDFGWRVLGWCLMTNHVHLVLDVAEQTISRGMQFLSGNYGQAFNWRHGLSGHLFQGRFRDEVVDDDSYASGVVRYVDLNPVRAGLVRHPAEWRHGGYRALAGLEPPRAFHDVEWTLDRFGPDRERARTRYADFVLAGLASPGAAVSARDMPGSDPGHGRNGQPTP